MIKISIILVFTILIIAIIILSYKRGKDAERIKQLKEEIKRISQEQKYANEQVDKIRNWSSTDIRNRLHQLANEQSRRMQ